MFRLKKIFFTAEYNEWLLEQTKRDEMGYYVADLNIPTRRIRLVWRIQFKGFFIHIGKDVKSR